MTVRSLPQGESKLALRSPALSGPAPFLEVEAEFCDEGGEFGGFLGQRVARGVGLFDHGGVLLGHLVHLVDGGVDLARPVACSRLALAMALTCSEISSMREMMR
jgi:hypothetical protein